MGCLVVASLLVLIVTRGTNLEQKLSTIKEQQPDLVSYVESVTQRMQEVKADPNNKELIVSLGMAWKSLADRTGELDFYREALVVYERGNELSDGKDMLFLTNAGNMAVYLGDYTLAEKYYKEAIQSSPGTVALYEKLIELYEFKMNKPHEEIMVVFEEAEKRVVINAGYLAELKEHYLERRAQKE